MCPPEGGGVGEQGGRPFPPYRLAPSQLAFLIFCSKQEYRTTGYDRKFLGGFSLVLLNSLEHFGCEDF